jgi:hypothetical protein
VSSTKPVLTRFYHVRPFARGWGWGARIWLTDDGCLSIYSDRGSYGYWWSHPGCEIREFLCTIDNDYLLSKLCSGKRDVIDDVGSERDIKQHILEYRRSGTYDREFARREWDLVCTSSFENEVEAHTWYLETEICDAHERLRYMRPPQAKAFVEHCWPPFVAELRRDIGESLREASREWFRRAA